MSEFEKDLRKKKEGTDTLNQNQENSTKPAVPAEGENNAPAAPAKKRIAAVYRPLYLFSYHALIPILKIILLYLHIPGVKQAETSLIMMEIGRASCRERV